MKIPQRLGDLDGRPEQRGISPEPEWRARISSGFFSYQGFSQQDRCEHLEAKANTTATSNQHPEIFYDQADCLHYILLFLSMNDSNNDPKLARFLRSGSLEKLLELLIGLHYRPAVDIPTLSPAFFPGWIKKAE